MKKRSQTYKISQLVEEIDESFLDQTIQDFEEDFSEDLEDFENMYHDEVSELFDSAEQNTGQFFEDLKEEHGPSAKLRTIVPGSDTFLEDEEDDELKEKSYEEGDVSKFPEYLGKAYQNIPRHSGESIAGCERAVSYLNKLDQEISKNIREDADHVLDVEEMAEYQQKILKDVVILKEHIKKLKRQTRDGAIQDKNAYSENYNLKKEAAGTVKLYVCVTPFIRGICGILINSVVSGGKPFDKVYDYLCKKYKMNDREELEIFQTLLDMGMPMFKDRGSLHSKDLDEKEMAELKRMEEELSGIDFITNYFA